MLNRIKFIFQRIKRIFKKIHSIVNLIINFVLLSLVYFLGVGFTFLLSRILGKRFFDMGIDKKIGTYWSDIEEETDNYYRQF